MNAHCEHLLAGARPFSTGVFEPWRVRWIRTQLGALGAGVAGRGRRLDLSRERAPSRRVTSEADLRPLLDGHGVLPATLEDLSVAGQVAAFRAAALIVAPHGAGLTNLAFCTPGTRVIEMVAPDYQPQHYCSLCHTPGLRYRPVVGGRNAASAGRAPKDRDFAVTPAALAAAIEQTEEPDG